MNYASLIFYTVTSQSVKGPEPLCFIHLFIYFHFQKKGGTWWWWGHGVKRDSAGEELSIGSVISNQWGCWGETWRWKTRLLKHSIPRNSCVFSFPKTYFLSFRASPLFCQIPIVTIGIYMLCWVQSYLYNTIWAECLIVWVHNAFWLTLISYIFI